MPRRASIACIRLGIEGNHVSEHAAKGEGLRRLAQCIDKRVVPSASIAYFGKHAMELLRPPGRDVPAWRKGFGPPAEYCPAGACCRLSALQPRLPWFAPSAPESGAGSGPDHPMERLSRRFSTDGQAVRRSASSPAREDAGCARTPGRRKYRRGPSIDRLLWCRYRNGGEFRSPRAGEYTSPRYGDTGSVKRRNALSERPGERFE